jgi:hypothetical protein
MLGCICAGGGLCWCKGKDEMVIMIANIDIWAGFQQKELVYYLRVSKRPIVPIVHLNCGFFPWEVQR